MNIVTQQKGLHYSIRKCTEVVTNTQTVCYNMLILVALNIVRRPQGLKRIQLTTTRVTMIPGRKNIESKLNSFIIDGTSSFLSFTRGVQYAR